MAFSRQRHARDETKGGIEPLESEFGLDGLS